MAAGDMRERVFFALQLEVDTSYGKAVGDWEEQFEVWARVRALVGSEPVLAQRLTGVQPVIVTVRSSSDTRLVTAAWRIRHKQTGALYNIRAVPPGERKDYIDFLCEAGVAQ